MDGVGVTIAFWILAVVTVGAALGVMAARNLLHAVLFLILAFIGVAGFFLLLLICPVIITAAWLFFLAFERPWLARRNSA